ncbi:MAG: endonuclease III domain-containing protein [Chromatiales bacterium]
MLTLRAVYQRLFRRYGPQHWWPGDTSFEVMVGAVLTQHTAWINVERAIGNLISAGCLDAEKISRMPARRLARLLRPAGYFNVKAKRLQKFCRWYCSLGGYDALARLDTEALRHELLSVNGIGPETADDILLYAFHRPVFVIDAYTRRIFSRLGFVSSQESYERLRAVFEQGLRRDAPLFNEYHALIVRHGKDICKTRPNCSQCCLARHCPSVQS